MVREKERRTSGDSSWSTERTRRAIEASRAVGNGMWRVSEQGKAVEVLLEKLDCVAEGAIVWWKKWFLLSSLQGSRPMVDILCGCGQERGRGRERGQEMDVPVVGESNADLCVTFLKMYQTFVLPSTVRYPA